MKSIRSSLLVAALLAAGSANAIPVTYDFTVTAETGVLTGASSSGYFTYDDTIVPVGGSQVLGSALTDLAFTWNSISYDETSALSILLTFTSTGDLEGAIFGSSCDGNGCGRVAGQSDWIISSFFTRPFFYMMASGTDGEGSVTWTRRAESVPEPGTFALFGIALAGVGLARRRKRA